MTNRERIRVRMRLNGEAVEVDAEPQESLAHVLRNRLGLTGTKVSCDVQVCGACTVLVDGDPVSACTFLAYEVQGERDVLTVEGLAHEKTVLHSLQRSFIKENAFQCGFCTSGMLLASYAFLTSSNNDEESLVDYMNGNICRCTGYLSILAAILEAKDELESREH